MWPTRLLPGPRLGCQQPNTVPCSRYSAFVAHEAARWSVVRARRSSTGATDASDAADGAAPKKRGRRPKTAAAADAEEPLGAAAPESTVEQQSAAGLDAAASDLQAATTASAPQGPKKRGPKPKAPTESADGSAPKKRGRKTKAEIEQAILTAQRLQAADESGDNDDADGTVAAPLAPAQGPGSWAEASTLTAGEEDRRRFPYHRRIHTAAVDGNIAGAEAAFASMSAAGLPPGPRAYHVLLCAYLKAGDLAGGLAVTGRATEAGVQLLPESYAALIFSHMELNPPDAVVAKTLYSATAGTDTDRQLPWAVLCRLLAAKGFAVDAVAAVREGLAAGLEMDNDVAEGYIKALCETSQSSAALTFLEEMGPRHRITPEARHVNYVVASEALSGNLTDARGLVDAAGARGWGRNAGTFNGLLAGLVEEIGKVIAADEVPGDELVTDFGTLRARMIQGGVRPDKMTFKYETEGHIKLADPRNAIAALKSMRKAAGTNGCQLLDSALLARLLQLLCDKDMPVDLLQVLVYMSEDGCRLPPGALAVDGEGRSLLSRWVLGHMEGIAARAEAKEQADVMLDTEIEYINDIAIGAGRCAVDDEGRVVPVSKCSMKQLRAECEARGVEDADDMKKPELVALVKAARARLPFNILKAQIVKGGRDDGAKAKPAKAGSMTRKGRRGWQIQEWSIHSDTTDGDQYGEVDITPGVREALGADQFLLEASALEALDPIADEYGISNIKALKEVNFDAVMEARMLDEGTAAIMNAGDEDVTTGFATLLPGIGEEDEEDDLDEDETKGRKKDEEMSDVDMRKLGALDDYGHGETLQEGFRQLIFLEDQQVDTDEANLVAGMDIALDVVRLVEILGGNPSPSDVLTLAAAAQAERSPNAAAAVATRLPLLLQPGVSDPTTGIPYEQDYVLQQFEELADMCLRFRSAQSADAVLEAAEGAGLRVSDDLLNRLTLALRGKARRGERLAMDRAALLEATGVDTNDIDLDLNKQQQQQPGAADSSSLSSSSSSAAAAAAPQVTDVEALSAVEQPLLGPAGEQQQQQPQEAAAYESSEDDEGELEEIDEDMAHVARLLKGLSDLNDHREHMMKVLTGAGGLSTEDAADVINQPVALLANMSWLPELFIHPDDDSDDDDQDDQDEGAESEAEGAEGEQPARTMTLLQLAHACATDSLTPDETDWLLQEAERHNVPLMLNEDTGKLIWPGTAEYNEWAQDDPEMAAEDQEIMRNTIQECYAEEWAAADAQADAFLKEFTNDDGSFNSPTDEEAAAMDQMTKMFLSRLAMEGMMDVKEAAEGDEAEVVATIDPSAAGPVDLDSELAELQEQLGPIIEAKKAALDWAELEELGVPLEEFFKDTPSSLTRGVKKLRS